MNKNRLEYHQPITSASTQPIWPCSLPPTSPQHRAAERELGRSLRGRWQEGGEGAGRWWRLDNFNLSREGWLWGWKPPHRLPLPGDQGGKIEMSTPGGKEISVWNVWEDSKRDATGAPTSRVEGIVALEPDRQHVCLFLAFLRLAV